MRSDAAADISLSKAWKKGFLPSCTAVFQVPNRDLISDGCYKYKQRKKGIELLSAEILWGWKV